jgi:hypothetical protein
MAEIIGAHEQCWCVTPHPDLYPRLPLTGNGDNGRLLVHLLGDPERKKATEIRVFCWVPGAGWPDDKPIPSQVVGGEQGPAGEFRIYSWAFYGRDKDITLKEFDSVRHGLDQTPWSQRFAWLEEHGFTEME